jgi:hypothetical protein
MQTTIEGMPGSWGTVRLLSKGVMSVSWPSVNILDQGKGEVTPLSPKSHSSSGTSVEHISSCHQGGQ